VHHATKPQWRDNEKIYFVVVVALSALVMAFRFIDALILGIVLPRIKIEFGLTDAQVGIIGGMPFALCYTLLAIPIAWLADTRFRRTRVIAVSIAFWSLMTTLSGAATGFAVLFLLRMGVGAGEAGFAPATYSLFSDLFPEGWRRRAIAIVGVGGNLGQFAALAIGGWSVETYGWRATYFIVGLPGILLALVYLLTVREPTRKAVQSGDANFFPDLGALLSSKTFLLLIVGAGATTMSGFAMLTWMPSYLERAHGIGLAEGGFALGICFGIGGVIGPFLFGWIADRLSLRDRRWTLRLCAILCMMTAPPMALTYRANASLGVAAAGYHCRAGCCTSPQRERGCGDNRGRKSPGSIDRSPDRRRGERRICPFGQRRVAAAGPLDLGASAVPCGPALLAGFPQGLRSARRRRAGKGLMNGRPGGRPARLYQPMTVSAGPGSTMASISYTTNWDPTYASSQ
jgi:predicted MFS family arabinose efflux permease